jgi:opacity protein-like surface antigen
MTRRFRLVLVCAVVLAGLAGGAGVASAGSPAAPDAAQDAKTGSGAARSGAASLPSGLGYWLDSSRSLGVGVDVSRIQPNVPSKGLAPASGPSGGSTRLIDTGLHFDAISFDLRLRWPTLARDASAKTQLQPYLSLGPALFVVRPDDVTAVGPLTSQRDLSLSLGVLGGAGLAWQFAENASLFGEYRFTSSGPEKFLPLGRAIGRDANTSDLLYGISVRF